MVAEDPAASSPRVDNAPQSPPTRRYAWVRLQRQAEFEPAEIEQTAQGPHVFITGCEVGYWSDDIAEIGPDITFTVAFTGPKETVG